MSRKARVLQHGVCEITQEFKGTAHKGIDIVKERYQLDNIVAHSDGTVVQVISNCNVNTPNDPSNPGNMVKIDHGNGYMTRYLHLAYNTVNVKVGQWIRKGTVLGYMGNTGNSFGGHLHFEVLKNGSAIDPTNYLDNDLPTSSKKSIEEVAQEVINGVYGNQPERQQRLEALGYNYREVQNKVNEMLGGGTKYLSNKSYKGVSIVDALNEIGINSSFSYRSKLASANGISNYKGTAEQNTQLLNLLKNGTLKQA